MRGQQQTRSYTDLGVEVVEIKCQENRRRRNKDPTKPPVVQHVHQGVYGKQKQAGDYEARDDDNCLGEQQREDVGWYQLTQKPNHLCAGSTSAARSTCKSTTLDDHGMPV